MASDIPSDSELTTDGLEASGGGRVLVLGCGALAREILAVIKANNLDHVDLQCLPAIYHNHPEKIVPAVEESVAKLKNQYAEIFLAYADCGTGGQLQATAERLGLKMLEGAHCYAFFEGVDAFAAHEDEITAFYLTDFLARQFDTFIWKPLGLDRHPELRDMYFGHYEKLVYQVQAHDPALEAKARNAAERLGLEFELRHTGYGDLERDISKL